MKETVALLESFLEKLGVEVEKKADSILFYMNEISTNDLVEMFYDGTHLYVQYFRDNVAISAQQPYYCPEIVPAIIEVMYAIDYDKNLGQVFKTLA